MIGINVRNQQPEREREKKKMPKKPHKALLQNYYIFLHHSIQQYGRCKKKFPKFINKLFILTAVLYELQVNEPVPEYETD